MNKKYEQFKKDIANHSTYLLYKRTKLKLATEFKEEELQSLHKAYVILANAFGGFAGAEFKMFIAKIIDSNLSHTDKYNKYKETILSATEAYNKVMSSRPNKMIKL